MQAILREVRLETIEINNFKNVKHGILSFVSGKKENSCEMIGVYGQNGSGKTALIDTLSILKTLLCGKNLPKKTIDFINIDSEETVLSFVFNIFEKETNLSTKLKYTFCIAKTQNDMDNNTDDNNDNLEFIPVVRWEELSLQISENGKIIKKMTPFINTFSANAPFLPQSKFSTLIDENIYNRNDLMLSKRMSEYSSRSYIFSRSFVNIIRKSYKQDDENCADKINFVNAFESFIYYGNYRLFIFDTSDSAMVNQDILKISFNIQNSDKTKLNGFIPLPINGNGLIPLEDYNLVCNLIENMNIVLQQIIPGLTVSVRKLNNELSENNMEMCRIQLISNKNSKPIPLYYESEGIKKIFTILQLLINVYNRFSFTVAIDELDSGVFEYLLGELIRIISTKGKGQLIFTSHNLRPLETLDKSCIAFTTTNPENRYIRPVNVKTTHNLRDFYYRDIVLGEQKEEVYDYTNNSEIAFALREAGEYCGS